MSYIKNLTFSNLRQESKEIFNLREIYYPYKANLNFELYRDTNLELYYKGLSRNERIEQHYIKQIDNELNSKEFVYYGLKDNYGKLMAFTNFKLYNHDASVRLLVVHPSLDKDDIGTHILNSSINTLNKINSIKTFILDCELGEVSFYENKGFSIIDKQEDLLNNLAYLEIKKELEGVPNVKFLYHKIGKKI